MSRFSRGTFQLGDVLLFDTLYYIHFKTQSNYLCVLFANKQGWKGMINEFGKKNDDSYLFALFFWNLKKNIGGKPFKQGFSNFSCQKYDNI